MRSRRTGGAAGVCCARRRGTGPRPRPEEKEHHMTTSPPAPDAPDTVVLIHGLWMTPRSWEHWIAHDEGRGFRVLAPTYPGFEGEVEALRADPSPIERVTIPETVAHLERIVGELDRPPILMGHSAGGFLVQALLDHG